MHTQEGKTNVHSTLIHKILWQRSTFAKRCLLYKPLVNLAATQSTNTTTNAARNRAQNAQDNDGHDEREVAHQSPQASNIHDNVALATTAIWHIRPSAFGRMFTPI